MKRAKKRQAWFVKIVRWRPVNGWLRAELSPEACAAVGRIASEAGIRRDKVLSIALDAAVRGVAPAFR